MLNWGQPPSEWNKSRFGANMTKLSSHEKRHCAQSCSNFNLSLWKKKKKCASNYLKCKINKSQTCVTSSPIIINKGCIFRERLEQKHSALLLSDEIKLSLERLPKSCTLTGKIKTILSSECHVTFNYNLTDASLLVGVHFRVGGTRSRPAPRRVSVQVLTFDSVFKTYDQTERLKHTWADTIATSSSTGVCLSHENTHAHPHIGVEIQSDSQHLK